MNGTPAATSWRARIPAGFSTALFRVGVWIFCVQVLFAMREVVVLDAWTRVDCRTSSPYCSARAVANASEYFAIAIVAYAVIAVGFVIIPNGLRYELLHNLADRLRSRLGRSRPLPSSSPRPALLRVRQAIDGLLALFVLTELFAALTIALFGFGLITGPPEAHAAGASFSEGLHLRSQFWHGAFWIAEQHYLRPLVGAIPLLEIPETLNWDFTTPFADHFSGMMLLLYKLVVILPVVRLIREWRRSPTAG